MQDPAGPPSEPQSPSALSAVPAAGIGRSRFAGGSVKFFYGPMDCGKSTLALQLDHNHARQGRHGLLPTRLDRSGPAQISSRMGLHRPAVDIDDAMDLGDLVRGSWARGRRRLFPGSARLFELADVMLPLQVEVLCWCGRIGRFNGRVIEGHLVRDGATFVVADTVRTAFDSAADSARGSARPTVRYQVLCRAHHRSGRLGPDGSTD